VKYLFKCIKVIISLPFPIVNILLYLRLILLVILDMPIYEKELVNFFWRSLMKRFILSILFSMLFSIIAIAEEAPIKISTSAGVFNPAITYVEITSISDNLVINKIAVNRGHCKLYTSFGQKYTKFPVNLSYGKKTTIRLQPSCNLLEVSVSTNQGSWSVSY